MINENTLPVLLGVVFGLLAFVIGLPIDYLMMGVWEPRFIGAFATGVAVVVTIVLLVVSHREARHLDDGTY